MENEIIEIEKPKRKVSEKQIENLRKMREKKLEISKAKKVLNLEKKPVNKQVEMIEEKPTPIPIPKNNDNDIYNRMTNIEKELYELKLRKQIKSELKQKLNYEKINKSKAIDKDEIENQKKEIHETNEKLQTIDYTRLFY